jgi:uncharacterized protein (TIGR02246 family)
MKQSIARLFALMLVGFAAEVLAGPAEEVAQIAAPRNQAFEDGNADAYAAAFADNAVLQSSVSAFRIEGKEAIRAYFTELFQSYPRRRVVIRQPATRVYNDDLVISNGYAALSLTDQRGQAMTLPLRYSIIWGKVGGRWQIVDQHVSRLPVAH